jgi:hypothetical protein
MMEGSRLNFHDPDCQDECLAFAICHANQMNGTGDGVIQTPYCLNVLQRDLANWLTKKGRVAREFAQMILHRLIELFPELYPKDSRISKRGLAIVVDQYHTTEYSVFGWANHRTPTNEESKNV